MTGLAARRAALARLLREDAEAADGIPRHAGGPAPLSFPQARLWFHQRYDPESPAYHSARAFRLTGPLDVRALEGAFRSLMACHDVLRTALADTADGPRQILHPHVPFALERVPALDGDAGAELRALSRRPFDLTRAPPLRAVLSEADPAGGRVLLVVMHHIAVDAWSTARLFRDLAQAYRAALADPARIGQPLTAQRLRFVDFAAWQRARFDGAAGAAAVARGRRYLGDAVPALDLPLDHPRRPLANRPGGRVDFALPADLAGAVAAFCRAHACPPFVALLATWQVLLARLSGQTDFAVGVPNAARTHPELQDLVGFLVNTQVYRVRLDPRGSFRDLCARLRGEAMAFLAEDDVPFERLVAETGIARDAATTPVFQAAFNFRPGRDAAPLDLAGVAVARIDVDVASAKFDAALDVVADGKDPPRDGIERVLAALWADILGLDASAIGRDDAFADLGGDSILSLKMLARIRRQGIEGGKTLTLAQILGATSLADLAERVAPTAPRGPEIVHLRRAGGRIPLFCVPGLIANATEFAALAARLGPERPVHGFVSHVYTEVRWQGYDVLALSGAYADCIAAHAPGGRCALVGWSSGGDLAYETARRLDGRVRVDFLGLVDVFESVPFAAPRALDADARALGARRLADWLDGSRMADRWRGLIARMDADEREALDAYLVDNPELPSDGPDLTGREFELWALLDKRVRAKRHAFAPLARPVHVFQAADSLTRPERLRDWSALAPIAGLRIIPGARHLDILRSTAFQDVFAESLDAAEA